MRFMLGLSQASWWTGRVMRKVVPAPGVLLAVMWPWCFCMMP
jgi:hypothetical protein